jgi:hypothetical protein
MAAWLLGAARTHARRRIVLRSDKEPRADFLEKIDKWNRHFALMVLRRDPPDFFEGGPAFERFFDPHLA